VKILFQDEARFGRMVRIRRCWAPAPMRPLVDNGYERQFTYVYGAVNPLDGQFDWMLAEKMNTETFSAFLLQVSSANPDDFLVMIVDGASSHVSKDLKIPENIQLHRLPPYSPELNPVEHLWDDIREKSFPNRVFSEMKAVIAQLANDLPALASDTARVKSITGWPWIIRLNLKNN
jgi:transposase